MTARMRTAAAVVLFVGLATVAIWLVLSGAGAASALAGVQEAMSRVKSVTFDATTRINDQPETKMKVLVLGAHLSRLERPDIDLVAIADRKNGRSLTLRHREKKAVVIEGFIAPENPVDLYERIRSARSFAAKRLGERTIDGRVAHGFLITGFLDKGEDSTTRLWIDPQTELPVRIESTKPLPMGGQVVEVATNFVFDAELDESLFNTTPPADYAVEKQVIPKRSPEELKKDETLLVIEPKVGMGPVRFGDSKDQVVKALGKPERRQSTPVGENLRYDSRGFAISLDTRGRFVAVQCIFYEERLAPIARSFRGRTDKGVTIGSSHDEIVEAYGPADYDRLEGKQRSMGYWDLGIDLRLVDDKLVNMLVSSRGK